MKRLLVPSMFAAAALVAIISPAQAAIVTFATPTPLYTSSTNLLPITQPSCTNTGTPGDPCPAGSLVTSLSGPGLVVTLSSPDAGNLVISRDPVPVGWATWNTPPAVESSTPKVVQDEVNLTCSLCTLTFSFSSAVKTFGFEAEPDPFGNTHTITATFLNGASTVGSIPIAFPSGAGSARLFAATTDQQFTSVRVTIDGTDFAMAQFRFSSEAVSGIFIPEPGTIMMLATGLAALGCFRKYRRA